MTMDNSNKLGPDQTQLSKCGICDKEFQTNNGLMNHFKSIHNLEKEYQCNICQKVFNSDGSGPKKTGSGRARALKVGLGPGPGLSPSLKAGLRAGPGLGPLPT